MRKLLCLSVLISSLSCGFKVKVDAKPVKVDAPTKYTIGPSFEEAALFCDNRYGAGTEASEDCFEDYRKFTQPKVGLDLDAINNFCEANYTIPEEIATCRDDLLDFIGSLNDEETE